MDQSAEKMTSNYYLIAMFNRPKKIYWIFELEIFEFYVHSNFFSSSLNHIMHSQSETQGRRNVLEIRGNICKIHIS